MQTSEASLARPLQDSLVVQGIDQHEISQTTFLPKEYKHSTHIDKILDNFFLRITLEPNLWSRLR